jgi:hypothetical protein
MPEELRFIDNASTSHPTPLQYDLRKGLGHVYQVALGAYTPGNGQAQQIQG